MKITRTCIALAALSPLAPAFGNGINPPRPAELALIQATCLEAPNAESPSLFRSRLVGGKDAGRLEFRSGQPPRNQSESLSVVTSVVLESKVVSADGYAKGKIALRDRDKPVEGSVKVRDGANEIAVAGFRENGERVEIPLLACVQIDFAVPGAAGEAPRAVKKD